MTSAFGVEHELSKARPLQDYEHNDQTPRQKLAFAQQADWVRGERHLSWVDGKRQPETLRAAASVRNEFGRRRASKSAKLLGSYRTRAVQANPHSEMGRAGSMMFSEYRPLHTRKRVVIAAAAAGAGAAAAAHHKLRKSAFGVEQ